MPDLPILSIIACIFSSLLSNALSKASATFINPLKSVSITGNNFSPISTLVFSISALSCACLSAVVKIVSPACPILSSMILPTAFAKSPVFLNSSCIICAEIPKLSIIGIDFLEIPNTILSTKLSILSPVSIARCWANLRYFANWSNGSLKFAAFTAVCINCKSLTVPLVASLNLDNKLGSFNLLNAVLIPSALAASSIDDEIKSPILSIANAAAITPPNLVNAEDRRPDTLLPISSNFLLPVSADLDIVSSTDFT